MHSPSPRPATIRPMYPPAPPSAYRPQVQQPQGLYPQATHPNAPPPPPPSTYPQPQYQNSAPNNAYAAQPNSFPQTMPYPMGNNAASSLPPQTNNVNGFASVSESNWYDIRLSLICVFFRRIIWLICSKRRLWLVLSSRIHPSHRCWMKRISKWIAVQSRNQHALHSSIF